MNNVKLIPPYSAQESRIIKLINQLREDSLIEEEIEGKRVVKTVDSMQGRENDVIIISFTRSNLGGFIGFLRNIRRTYVAISRAKKKLIILIDFRTFKDAPHFGQLLKYAKTREKESNSRLKVINVKKSQYKTLLMKYFREVE